VWEPDPATLLLKKVASFYGTRMFITGYKFPAVDSILCHLNGIPRRYANIGKSNISFTMLLILSVRIKNPAPTGQIFY
jgi:hypothetical protein